MKTARRVLAIVIALTMSISLLPYIPFSTLATEAISLDQYERENYLQPESLPMDAEPTVILPTDADLTAGVSTVTPLDGNDWLMAEAGTEIDRVGLNDDGLVGYWPFNEGSGSITKDLTGTTPDLTLGSLATFTDSRTSGLRTALDCTTAQNSNSRAYTTNFAVDFGNEFSISLFIKSAPHTNNWLVFMAKGGTVAGDWQLYFYKNMLRFYGAGLKNSSGAANETLTSSKEVADNNWHHIAVTLKDGTLRMYIDGALDASLTDVNGTLSNGERQLNFGSKENGASARACAMDEVRFYTRALDAAEIASLAKDTTDTVWTDGINATVPASVHTNLVNAGLLADPYVSLNDAAAQKESLKTWWMQKSFTYEGNGKNVRLNFEGVCDKATFWLNGVCIGSHQGMFGGPYLDVSDVIRPGKNTLTVRLDPAIFYKDTVVFNCTQGWHYAKLWPLGIWNSVSIEDVAAVQIVDPFIATKDPNTGTMDFTVDLRADAAFSGTLKLKVSPKNFDGDATIYTYAVNSDAATATARLQFDIPDPRLWWPNGYGEQNLYWLEVAFEDAGGNVIDYQKTSFGIRTIEMGPTPAGEAESAYNWTFIINGKSIFMKGTGWCTTDALMRFTKESYDTQLSRAKAQGINFVRAWGGGMPETETFYDLCDEYGLCVYQEWPLHDNSYQRQPTDVLYETVELNTVRLRNRASLIMWGGGNECKDVGFDNEVINTMGKLTLENDGTRPWHRQDPYGDGNAHNYNTYWGGQPLDRYLQLSYTFLSEFGLPSMPNLESITKYADPSELNIWPIEEGSDIWHHTPLFGNSSSSYATGDIAMMSFWADEFVELDSVESLVIGTQLAQTVGIRHQLEKTRTRWPRATGIAYYKLNDVYPGASWSTVDWYGSPKMSYYFLQDAYQSLAAVGIVSNLNNYGKALDIPIWLLDDTDELAESDWTVSARAYNGGLELVKEISFTGNGSIGATKQLGTLSLTAEQTETAPLFIVTDVEKNGSLAARNYIFLNYEQAIGSLFALPVTTLTYTQTGNSVTVTNTGDKPAVAANLLFADSTVVTPNDNFVWLEPDETQVITLDGVGDADVSAAVVGLTAWNAKDDSDAATPTTPTGFAAVDCDRSSITLTWDTADDANCYMIYRDGVLIATVNGKMNTYTDYRLSESTRYTYTICAVNKGGNASETATVQAATTSDITQPTLLSATMPTPDTVVMTFSEPLNETSAETTANYAVSGGATVENATLQAGGTAVTLKLSGATRTDYTVTVSHVTDVHGYAVIPATKFIAYGLVGYWQFESGSETKDTTGNHTDLTIGAGSSIKNSKDGFGTAFSGIQSGTSYAIGQTATAYDGDFSLSLFIQIPSGNTQNWKVFMSKGALAATDWQWYFHSGKVRFYAPGLTMTGNTSDANTLQSTRTIHDGAWHHLALTMSGSTLTMYIDGAVTATGTVTAGAIANGEASLNFGQKEGGSAFLGLLDEARIYNIALTADEIAALNAGAPIPVPTPDRAAFKGASVTLGDDLDMNFAVDIPESVKEDGMKVTFTLDGAELPSVTPSVQDGTGYYLVTAEVPAKDMTAELVARLVSADGNTVYTAKSYSIREYSEAIINGSYQEADKSAAKAMLNYGAMAQLYFGHRVENLANAGYAYTQAELDAASLGTVSGVHADCESTPAAYVGTSLLLKNKLGIRMYFSENLDGSLLYNEARDLYYYEFSGIGADDIATTMRVTLNGITYEVSALSLARQVVNGESYRTDFKNLMKALALYHQESSRL